MKISIIIACLSVLYSCQCVTPNAFEHPPFQYGGSVSRFQMYTGEFSRIPVLIHNKVNLLEWTLKSTDKQHRFYRLIKLEACDGSDSLLLDEKDCSRNNFQTKGVFKSLNDTDEYKIGYILIDAILVGRGSIQIQPKSLDLSTNNDTSNIFTHNIIIIAPERFLDKFHRVYILVFTVIVATFMGLLIEVPTILKIIKMPIPVLIGLACQYICMPLLAFACIRLFSFSGVNALAIFIYGCCPGGSGSNNWTIMFDGDIDLSAIMTFVSTMASLVFMPAWVYSLGSIFIKEANINIPFMQLIIRLLWTILPCLFGLMLSKFFPKLKKIVLKVAKPVIMFVLISFLALTLYIKAYVYTLVAPSQWLTAPFIPWLGFLIGGGVSLLFRLPRKQVYTIGLETGIQNTGIAFLIIIYNFPTPESDYAILPLVSIGLFTAIPLYLTLLVVKIVRKIKEVKKKRAQANVEVLNGDKDVEEAIKLNATNSDEK